MNIETGDQVHVLGSVVSISDGGNLLTVEFKNLTAEIGKEEIVHVVVRPITVGQTVMSGMCSGTVAAIKDGCAWIFWSGKSGNEIVPLEDLRPWP